MARKKRDTNAYVTNKVLDEAVEAILNGMSTLFNGLKKEFGVKFDEVDERFDEVDERFDGVDTELKHIRQDVNDLKFDTPTKDEFKKLEKRVDKYHPVS